MSKAIYGHMGGSDALLVAEVTRLRRRVVELEEQVAALEAADALRDGVEISLRHDDIDAALRELGESAPVLT
jgi:hypothetical protein